MLKVDPNTLYSLDELREKLHGIVELPTLLDRLGVRDNRVFRDAIWGWEILDASRKAAPFSRSDTPYTRVLDRAKGGNSGRAQKTNRAPVRKLSSSDLCD